MKGANHKKGRGIVISVKSAEKRPTSSWWTTAPRDGFSKTADRVTSIPVSTHPASWNVPAKADGRR